MLIPYTVDVPMQRLPWANWCLLASTGVLSVAVFCGAFQANDSGTKDRWEVELKKLEDRGEAPPEIGTAARIAKRLFAKSSRSSLALRPDRFHWRQLLTYQLIQTNAVQWIVNMVFLFAFGNAVNAKVGHVLFLASYFAFGMIAGGIWWAWGSQPLAESSGGVMGVMGMFLVFYPRNEVRCVRYRRFSFGRTVNVAAIWIIGLYLISDLVGTLISGGGKAYAVHLSSCVAGIMWAAASLHRLPPSDEEENLLDIMRR